MLAKDFWRPLLEGQHGGYSRLCRNMKGDYPEMLSPFFHSITSQPCDIIDPRNKIVLLIKSYTNTHFLRAKLLPISSYLNQEKHSVCARLRSSFPCSLA